MPVILRKTLIEETGNYVCTRAFYLRDYREPPGNCIFSHFLLIGVPRSDKAGSGSSWEPIATRFPQNVDYYCTITALAFSRTPKPSNPSNINQQTPKSPNTTLDFTSTRLSPLHYQNRFAADENKHSKALNETRFTGEITTGRNRDDRLKIRGTATEEEDIHRAA